MNGLYEKIVYRSSDRKSKVAGILYLPLEHPRAVVQISHGMCEYIRRYESLSQLLCRHGIAVCGNDHLGHLDTTIASGSFKGYFGGRGGYRYLVDDLYLMQQAVRQQLPQLPYVLLGHSMGSFVARLYAEKYPHTLDALILSGTADANPLAPLGISLARYICNKRGDKYISAFLCWLIEQGNNSRIQKPKTKKDWLSRDAEVVQRYLSDPGCNFPFTASANHDLLVMLEQCNRPQWFTSLPRQLPVYLLSGGADPIGAYGKGVRRVAQRLLDAGMEDVEMRLYPGARHELFNEINKQEVCEHLLDWLEQRIAPLGQADPE